LSYDRGGKRAAQLKAVSQPKRTLLVENRHMDWKTYINETYKKAEYEDFELTPIYSEPANLESIEIVEEKLGIEFHDELRSLLLETNGIREWMKTDKWEGETGYLVFSLDKIEEENLCIRSLDVNRDNYMPFENLLFIAPAGNGDLFGYSINNGQIRRSDIFVWNHEDDSRVNVAPSLKRFLELLKSGNVKY
jgi:hypothetical protein